MLTLNRSTLAALGLVPTDITNWLTGAASAREALGVPGRTGVVLGGKQAAPPRLIDVGVMAPLASLTDRAALIARVTHALLDQRVALVLDDRPTVQTWAYCGTITWREGAPNVPKFAIPAISAVGSSVIAYGIRTP